MRDLIYCNTWKILLIIRGHIAMILMFSFLLKIDYGSNGPSGRMLDLSLFFPFHICQY
jgi:hypothetical protein